MLKNIPSLISPDLLKVLAELGHGDRLVIADANFPSATMGKNACVIRMDGHKAIDVAKAILTLIPLDQYSETKAMLMDKVPGDETETPIWDEFEALLCSEGYEPSDLVRVERQAFYQLARESALIIATGETALYGNLILQKGVI